MKNEKDLSFSPLVSIIIPTYNGSRFLRFAIECAISQTYKKKEIIVINDGSVDSEKTREICNSYGEQISYFEKKNGGVSSALNLGVSKAKGDLVMWLSHDDGFLRNAISEEVKALSFFADKKTIIFTNTLYINEKNKRIFHLTRRIPHNKLFTKPALFFDYTINGCSLLLPREALLKHPFDESLVYIPDTTEWFTLMEDGYSYYYLRKKLCLSRVHNGQITKKSKNTIFPKEYPVFCKNVLAFVIEKNDKYSLKRMLYGLCLRKYRYPFEKTIYVEVKEVAIKEGCFSLPVRVVCAIFSLIGLVFR